MTHHGYIERTFKLALRGLGRVAPNPMVGAVLVKEGQVIGEGFHEYFGGPHAEVNAINNATQKVDGATLYCNLEPCRHRNKKTSPCVDLIVKSKISKVVVSNLDPNPMVSGKGGEDLKKAGIEFTAGILESEGSQLNEVFFKYMTSQKPFIHIKVAQTLDGKTATKAGHSKWISGETSREEVHFLRKKYRSILIGRKTLNQDNPRLTCRSYGVAISCPFRIVVGNPNSMNLDSFLFNDEFKDKTIVVSTIKLDKIYYKTRNHLKNVHILEGTKGWEALWSELGKKEIDSVLVEGGAFTINSLLQEDSWDKMSVFVSPLLLGNGPDIYRSKISTVDKALLLKKTKVDLFGSDVCITGYRQE